MKHNDTNFYEERTDRDRVSSQQQLALPRRLILTRMRAAIRDVRKTEILFVFGF